MESFRQVMSTIYFAMANAAGGDAALRRANAVLEDAVFSGAVTDPYAQAALLDLVENSDPPRPVERRKRAPARGGRSKSFAGR
jgi:hypothetical protein